MVIPSDKDLSIYIYIYMYSQNCLIPLIKLKLNLSLPLFRYGFDYGPVHFFLMSTEHDFTVGSPQYTYIKSHLSSVDRSKTPWLVFAGHRSGISLPHMHTLLYPLM